MGNTAVNLGFHFQRHVPVAMCSLKLVCYDSWRGICSLKECCNLFVLGLYTSSAWYKNCFIKTFGKFCCNDSSIAGRNVCSVGNVVP